MISTTTTTPTLGRSPLGNKLLKALAAGALFLALAGCIPIPVLSITPTAAVAGESVDFDGSGTIVSNIPADTVAVSYRWTFGDGQTGSGASTTHIYEKAGSYEVTLRVIDSAGRVGETMETVMVSAATDTAADEVSDTASETTAVTQ